MKKKQKMVMGFLMALLAIFISSVDIAAAKKSHRNHSPDKSCAHQEVKQVQGSKIVFQEGSFDFGQIPYNRKVTHIFRFKNAGTSPLLLARHVLSKAIEGC
jgi:hypothetical protein